MACGVYGQSETVCVSLKRLRVRSANERRGSWGTSRGGLRHYCERPASEGSPYNEICGLVLGDLDVGRNGGGS